MSIYNASIFLLINWDSINLSLLAMLISMVGLLFLSAMVSGSEVAFFSLSPYLVKELEEEQSSTSMVILELLASPRELLATILIFNNFINVSVILLSSLVSAMLFLPESFVLMGIEISGELQVFLLNVVLITFLLLVFGEVLPKVYASRFPIKLLRFTAKGLSFVNSILVNLKITPLLVGSTNFFTKASLSDSQSVTVDDLQHAVNLTSDINVELEDRKRLSGIVKFGNTDVKQIMTPRVKSILIELDTPFQEVVKVIKESHLSRIPIFKESIDVVKGVIYAKDLLPYLDKDTFDWASLMRDPFFVPENKKIDDLLTEFQEKKTHLAIVVDEYGGVSGLVSLEDVIEEIVGDITDEFDVDESYYSKLSDNVFVFEGQTSLINMYRALGVNGEDFEDKKGEADSIAGFVLEIAGRIPQKGETIIFLDYRLTIESADKRRVSSVKVELKKG